MDNHAEYQNFDPNPVANDIPEDIHALIPADIRNDLKRVHALKRSKRVDDLSPEEQLADDWTWLWDFEHNGEKLSEKEITFLIEYARSGFEDYKKSAATAELYRGWIRPVVNAALHQLTKNTISQWQCSLAKVHRVLFHILESKPTDVMDVTPAGIVLKDFSKIDPAKLAAVQEIHEIRNHQGTQTRIKFYDKIASATTLARLMGGFSNEKVDVNITIKGFEDRLATALQRISHDDVIDGEVVAGE